MAILRNFSKGWIKRAKYSSPASFRAQTVLSQLDEEQQKIIAALDLLQYRAA